MACKIAVFRVGNDDRLYALGNFDPFSKAMVLLRGIVGDRKGTGMVASPICKQSFALATGQCLDDRIICVPAYPVRLRARRVEIACCGYAAAPARDAGELEQLHSME